MRWYLRKKASSRSQDTFINVRDPDNGQMVLWFQTKRFASKRYVTF